MDIKRIVKYLQFDEQKKFVQLVLSLSLLIFIEIAIVILLSQYLNGFLVLSLLFMNSLISYGISILLLKSSNKSLKNALAGGVIPTNKFNLFIGTFLIATLYLIPGFLTTTIALILSFDFFRTLIGKKLIKKYKFPTEEIYNYVKIYELNLRD